jgi:hypothetical protein
LFAKRLLGALTGLAPFAVVLFVGKISSLSAVNLFSLLPDPLLTNLDPEGLYALFGRVLKDLTGLIRRAFSDMLWLRIASLEDELMIDFMG